MSVYPLNQLEILQLEVPDPCISGLLCIRLAEKRPLVAGEIQSFPERQNCWYLFAVLEGSLSVTHENNHMLLGCNDAAIISGNSVTSIWPSENGSLLVFCFQGIAADMIVEENRTENGLFFGKNAGAVRNAYIELSSMHSSDGRVPMAKTSAVMYSLLMRLYKTGKASREERSVLPKIVQEALRMLQRDFAFLDGIAEVADRLQVSQEYLTRSFRKSMGIPPGKYLNQLKMEYAKMLFRQGGHSVSFVADACGFANYNYFSRVFREATGVSPTEYMKNNIQNEMEDPMLDPFYVL